ncbi:hypothetical protein [Pseudoalteromonas lipolytica]|uniref:hypothetical protein n=1 Tax=Pseudoalteromonas lipolytica TaxID=570156 RepID=UPI003A977468
MTERDYILVYTTILQKSYQLLISGGDLIIDDKNYLTAMADQLAQDGHVLPCSCYRFLSINGYLAANKHTNPRYIMALKAAFNEVSKYNGIKK